MTKIKGVLLEVELFGRVREVKFQDGAGLQIAGLTYQESLQLLRAGSTGELLAEPVATPSPGVAVEAPAESVT